MERHESYGMIGISQKQGHDTPLFGSAIKHSKTVCIEIKEGSVKRNHSQDWFCGGKKVIEIEMSKAQFAELITSPNQGDGVPCTIRKLGEKRMETPQYKGHNEIFHQEMQKVFQKALADAKELASKASTKLNQKGQMKVAEKKELQNDIGMLVQHIEKNIPFLHQQFTKSMSKTVSAAKMEIESFHDSRIEGNMRSEKNILENSS